MARGDQHACDLVVAPTKTWESKVKRNRQRKIFVRQCITEADGCARWEADAYLLSLPSYLLLLEKTRQIGNTSR